MIGPNALLCGTPCNTCILSYIGKSATMFYKTFHSSDPINRYFPNNFDYNRKPWPVCWGILKGMDGGNVKETITVSFSSSAKE
jgi:hypothetical protein